MPSQDRIEDLISRVELGLLERGEHAAFVRHERREPAVLPGGHGAYIGEVSAARLEGSHVRLGDAGSPAKKESRSWR